jgi:hypothetical protein
MNFQNILSEIERLDPEVFERTSERRSVIKNWTRKVSLTALPFALGALFNKAYGKANDAITDVLQFALKLEYIESELYRKAVEATEVNPPKNQLIPTVTGLELPAIKKIWQHEQQHVSFLYNTLTSMGQTPIAMPKIDFSGGSGSSTGQFAQVFSDYGTFLALAQTFEDLGVRAYKGTATVLKSNNDILTAAMRIHSVEARHAAHIRTMRSQTPGPLSDGQIIMPWITMKQTEINNLDVQNVYDGEENTIQNKIEVIDIAGFLVPDIIASEAFDEPLSMDTVNNILIPFLIP